MFNWTMRVFVFYYQLTIPGILSSAAQYKAVSVKFFRKFNDDPGQNATINAREVKHKSYAI